MKKFLLLCFIFIGVIKVFGQDGNCGQKLRLASSIYDQGRLHELEGLLTPCLDSGGFSLTEKVTAYKFLILAYIYLEEPEKADATMLKILETDHYFEVNEQVDPAEFKALYNTFRTWEIYRLGVKVGANMTQNNLMSSNNITTGTTKYSPGYGFSASFIGEIPLSKISRRLTFAPEVQIQLSAFKSKTVTNGVTTNVSTDTTTKTPTTFNTVASQKLSYLSIPLLIQYEFGNKNLMNNKNRKIRPYLTGGISPDYLFGSTRSSDETRAGFAPINGSYSTTSSMNKINLSAILGAGFRWRIAGGFFLVEARYKYGFSKVPISSQTYSNEIEAFGPKYTPAIYTVNAISLSVGYVQNFFKPKKLKPRK